MNEAVNLLFKKKTDKIFPAESELNLGGGRFPVSNMEKSVGETLLETNIAPENKPSQRETSIPTIYFQVAFAVSFREGNNKIFPWKNISCLQELQWETWPQGVGLVLMQATKSPCLVVV